MLVDVISVGAPNEAEAFRMFEGTVELMREQLKRYADRRWHGGAKP
jgi:hypothetical protein